MPPHAGETYSDGSPATGAPLAIANSAADFASRSTGATAVGRFVNYSGLFHADFSEPRHKAFTLRCGTGRHHYTSAAEEILRGQYSFWRQDAISTLLPLRANAGAYTTARRLHITMLLPTFLMSTSCAMNGFHFASVLPANYSRWMVATLLTLDARRPDFSRPA